MATSKDTIEISKITGWIGMLFIGFLGWFGKVTYDKLISMDSKLEMLLIQNGVYKTKIEDIESQIKQLQPCVPNNDNNKATVILPNQYGILPEDWKKNKHSLAVN